MKLKLFTAPNSSEPDADILIKRHGPRGKMIKVLYAFRMLGWVIAAVLLFFVGLRYVLSAVWTQPVLVVNERGELVGQIDYYNTMQRTQEQFIGGGMAFLNYKLSLNSASIFHDSANALSMMGDNLRERESTRITTELDPTTNQPVLLSIESHHTRSWIDYGSGVDAPHVEGNKEGLMTVRYKGQLVVVGERRVEKPFDITVSMRATPRQARNPTGVEVENYNDN